MTVAVAIIGAGPYGLSLAAHLAERGVEHRIIGTPMGSWEHHMPEGMFLKSEGLASSIDDPAGRWTLKRFCEVEGHPYADAGLPVSIETFRAYGHWFTRHLVPHLENDRVTVVSRDGAGFTIELASSGRVTAERVVVATGLTAFGYVPPPLRSLPAGRVSHTSDYRSFAALLGRRVAVVGAGQSALETAALLRESGAQPELVVRRSRLSWNPDPQDGGYGETRPWELRPTPLGGGWRLWVYWNSMPGYHLLPERFRASHVRHTLGPAGAWWLRPRVDDVIPVGLGETLVAGAAGDDGGVVLRVDSAGGARELRVDHVIAGTGYRVDVERLAFLAPSLRAAVRRTAGSPVLTSRFESSVPGLYFVGLAAARTFGPAMRFVCGTQFVGPRLGRRLAAASRGGGGGAA
jgi:thioredoxin reductase